MPFLEREERMGRCLGLPEEEGHSRLLVQYPVGRDPE